MIKGAGVFFSDGKRVLLLRKKDGSYWGLPGGHARKGETALETATRECQEETGRKPLGKRLGAVRNDDWVTFLFEINRKFHCNLSKEHSEWRWVNIEDAKRMRLFPKLKENFAKYVHYFQKGFLDGFKDWMDNS